MKSLKFLLVTIILIFQGCATKNLSDKEVVRKALLSCQNPEVTIMIIPSRGPLADSMSITAIKTNGNDGGFSKDFSKYIKANNNNIAVYCPNTQKTEAYLSHTLSLYKDDELKKVSICVLGMKNSKDILNEAHRTGSKLTFVP